MAKKTWLLLAVLGVALAAGGAYLLLRAPAPEPAPHAEVSSSPWGADYFPNVVLTAHTGEQLRFFDDVIKDKVVMINFIYTSCADACPLETARLKQVQKLLGDRVGKDVFLYSITIDPETDTPEVLRAYAEKFRVGPGWLFLHGSEEDVTVLRKKFGMYESTQDMKANLVDHIISLIIGNQKTGQWIKSSAFDSPQLLATKVGTWLHNWKLPNREKRDYAEAPELRRMSRGESLFRSRCAACHTIGGGDVADAASGDIGPDLFGVTQRRDPAWLARFIAEPDRMIAEQDPLALSLLARYNNIAMPNLRLNELEVTALVDYLAEESRRIAEQPKDAPAAR